MERYRAWHEPTQAQTKTGNYKKRKLKWQGLTIRIENEAGSIRAGKNWETRMVYPYGYFVGSKGVDGDEVDVFVGSNQDAPFVYVIHQRKAGDWASYDEDKVMIGFDSLEEAQQAYLLNYNDDRFLGPVTTMPVAEFIEKLKATQEHPQMIKAILFFKSPLLFTA